MFLNHPFGQWGSTFWPSPQSTWIWPPLKAIDREPYQVSTINNSIYLKSQIDTKTKLSVSKTIQASENDTSFYITYTIINKDTVTQQYAPWEITRVPPSGMSFFANSQEQNKIEWINLNEPCDKQSKVFYDGSGWQAYLNKNILFIKTYDNIAPEEAAPKESEFQLYREKSLYVEIENQGKYEQITAGDSISWQVKWIVRKLPVNIKPEIDNPELVSYVKGFVQK